MSRVIQPSVAKRIAFAVWARHNGVAKTSSATFVVNDDVDVPETLMIGAQVDGQAYEPPAPKTRKRTRKAPVEEAPAVDEPQESYVQKYERSQAEAKSQEE